ncbi:MAG TPA: hypothetical protein VKZ59_08450 [Acidobacteriota bacterium]|nr:hypothetical protein [Acidobacteriota bacterium]
MEPGEEEKLKIEEFMNQEFHWKLSAGECNFLIQLLVHLVQENPPLVRDAQGQKENLNYQSIRTIVLINEKLSQQLQEYAREASIGLGEVKAQTNRVQ